MNLQIYKDDLKKELHFSRYYASFLPETFENYNCKIEYEENSFEYPLNLNPNNIGKQKKYL